VLAHPARLPILLTLESLGPRTAQQLLSDLRAAYPALDIDDGQVKYSLQQLRNASLVNIVDTRPTSSNLAANVYDVARHGWHNVLNALQTVT
jgi:hypothetical protein